MHVYCDRCGFERNYTGAMSREGHPCEVCRAGRMRSGNPAGGFTVGADFRSTPRNMPVPAYAPVSTGTRSVPGDFNYFAALEGKPYQQFVQEHTSYIGRFTNLLLPDADRFAWLNPYTGNKHNRTHFTQLVLARVARAKAVDNGGRLPRLIEPFVGSGQVFLNSTYWGPSLNDGMPLFGSVVAGDLNHYVIGSYWAMCRLGADFVAQYLRLAEAWDSNLAANYEWAVAELAQGRAAVADLADRPNQAVMTCFKYIWLVNRCLRGTSLNATGGITASCKHRTPSQLALLRQQEAACVGAVVEQLSRIRFDFACRDFRLTCDEADRLDVVLMDCPFPVFSNKLVRPDHPSPAKAGSRAASTYGTGDDGEELQQAIVDTARKLLRQGTTVILCNFANPGLVQAYQGLIENVAATEHKYFTFTYRSPSTTSEAYQLTIVPGLRNGNVAALPRQILADWQRHSGEDVLGGEFFASHEVLDETEMDFQLQYDAQQARREEEDSDFEQ
ncbi:hypothetical protein AB0I39_39505 [Kitasatospora purpeofusca]|uniref:hypothetical protein n=1 Tax=Kitasatospora purpeofusca TaxID=67352 RepID=UPI0033D8B613